jgi:hypothetical protein
LGDRTGCDGELVAASLLPGFGSLQDEEHTFAVAASRDVRASAGAAAVAWAASVIETFNEA